MFSVIENSLNLDALYLVKLIFGDFFLLFRLKLHHHFIAIVTVLGRKSRSGARELTLINISEYIFLNRNSFAYVYATKKLNLLIYNPLPHTNTMIVLIYKYFKKYNCLILCFSIKHIKPYHYMTTTFKHFLQLLPVNLGYKIKNTIPSTNVHI